ncbi:MAG: hypothetical protein V2B18_19640, partial [Pseudomonadota bacterium]
GILSDLPALSMALVALGFLLRIVTRNGGAANWAGLTLSLLLTYQIRAAYLFLIPLTPILGFALLVFRESGSRWILNRRRFLAGLVVICVIPFLLFSAFRYVITGHFGLLSIGGLGLAGITTQFMDRRMIERFDPELRDLAHTMIETRDRLLLGPPAGRLMWSHINFWKAYEGAREYVIIPCSLRFVNNMPLVPAPGERIFPHEINPAQLPAANDIATGIALATIRERPGIHLLYYLKSFAYQVSFTFYVNGTITFLLISLFMAQTVLVFRGRIRGDRIPAIAYPSLSNEINPLQVLATVSGLFYLTKVFMCTLVEATWGHYLLAASALVPSAVSVALFALFRNWTARSVQTCV